MASRSTSMMARKPGPCCRWRHSSRVCGCSSRLVSRTTHSQRRLTKMAIVVRTFASSSANLSSGTMPGTRRHIKRSVECAQRNVNSSEFCKHGRLSPTGVLRGQSVFTGRQHLTRLHSSTRVRASADQSDGTNFDLQLAITLGGAAFEAYKEPLEKKWQDSTSSDTKTTFLDGDFFDSEFTGVVTVKLLRAEGLPARDLWGTSDPYATFSLGDSFGRSSVVDRNCDPEWNETFYLFVKDPEEQKFIIRCFDMDMITSDDSLGYTFLPAKAVCQDGEKRSFTLDLSGEGGGGTITFETQYTPVSDINLATLDDVDAEAVKGTPTEILDAWTTLAAAAGGRLPIETLDPVCYVDNIVSDTQAWVLYNKEERHVCVSFRGTEQTKLKDIVTDINFILCDFDAERTTASFFNKDQMQVHNGFLTAYDSIKVKLLSIVDSLTESDGAPGDWTVYVTGHSLGGALATLFSLDLSTRWQGKESAPKVVMYNYGSPRVGNKKFAETYNKMVKDSWRVFNKNDIVSSVPRSGQYMHVDNAVAVSEEGKLEIYGNHGINDVLGEGMDLDELVPGLFEKGLDLEANEELKALVEQELEILASLSSGQGILEHLEDFYLAVFTKIIEAIPQKTAPKE